MVTTRKGASRREIEETEARQRRRHREATSPSRKLIKETEHRPKPEHREAEHRPKPEHREEPRELKDLWKAAFPVGTGWDKMDSVHDQFEWDFSNLEQAFEEKGQLYNEIVDNRNKVYLFGTVEVHVWRQEKVTVPVVVAVASYSPPSDEMNVMPVELDDEGGGEESRIPMTQLKMDWIPYSTLEFQKKGRGRSPRILVLGSTRKNTSHEYSKNEEPEVKFQYLIPCLDHQDKDEHYECPVQRELDELAKNIISETIQGDEELSPDLKAGLKEYVADKLYLAKRKHRQSYREKISKTQKEGTSRAKSSQNTGKIYKFYPVPTSETPDVSKTKYPFTGYYCEQDESKSSLCDFAASISEFD